MTTHGRSRVFFLQLCALLRNAVASAAGCWQPVALEAAVQAAAVERRGFLALQLREGRVTRLRYLGSVRALDQVLNMLCQ